MTSPDRRTACTTSQQIGTCRLLEAVWQLPGWWGSLRSLVLHVQAPMVDVARWRYAHGPCHEQ